MVYSRHATDGEEEKAMGRASVLFEQGELVLFKLRPGQSVTAIAQELDLEIKGFYLLRANPALPRHPLIVGQVQGDGRVGIYCREQALVERARELMEECLVSFTSRFRRWIGAE